MGSCRMTRAGEGIMGQTYGRDVVTELNHLRIQGGRTYLIRSIRNTNVEIR